MRWFPNATVCLIAWGVLAFGAEYPWAYVPLLIFAATIGTLGLAAPTAGRSEVRPLLVPFALVLAAVGVQLIPLPDPVLAVLSPARLVHDWPALVAATVPAAPGAEPAAAGGAWPLSINPARTLLGAAFLAGLALFFAGTCRALAVVRASAVVRGVVAVGLLVALIAIAQATSDSPRVYGFWWPRKIESTPAAPLINENHLAGWLLMALSMAGAYLCSGFADGGLGGRVGWRRGVRWLASREGSITLLAGLSAFVIAVAVIVTGSVSGIAGFLVVCFVLSRCLTRRARDAPVPRLVRVLLIALPVAAITWVGFDVVGEEVAAASWSDIGGRLPIWRDTLSIVRDFAVTGTGWNTYGIAMLAYQAGRPGVHVVEAHSDYLQLAAEGGILVGAPVLLAVFVFVRQVRTRFRDAADDIRIHSLRVGAVAGLLALAVQSLVDFSLQMPGNAVLFTLLMAIAVHRAPPRVHVHEGSRTTCG
ncbi:MAG: O-antigen ligase family protein [Acidobacteria bacterium]|nr:O-antigen ligase family protein [Acidobacteriota bacterium]